MISSKHILLVLLNLSAVGAFSAFSVTSVRGTIHSHTVSTQLNAGDNTDGHIEHSTTQPTITSRRECLSALPLFAATAFAALAAPTDATAFDNKISNQYDDRPKRRGPQPKDLGVASRKDMVGEEYMGLKNCGPAPNCFCSTDDVEDDPDHSIPSWTWPKGMDQLKAFEELEGVVKNYQPGQGNIDGGGFKIVTSDAKKGYMYVQFEQLKAGYIDDVEFAVINGLGENSVQVRSSSRVGYLDFGVNSKRLNYIAKALKEKGWVAPGVDYDSHKGYFAENNVGR